MKSVLLFFMSLGLCCGAVVAQDPYLQGEPSGAMEAFAKELLEKYQPELVMDSYQLVTFEKKLIEYLMRRKEIYLMNASKKQKRALLRKLNRYENAEMANILTRPQLRYYINIKRRLQPVGSAL